jgi:hypothetical protein
MSGMYRRITASSLPARNREENLRLRLEREAEQHRRAEYSDLCLRRLDRPHLILLNWFTSLHHGDDHVPRDMVHALLPRGAACSDRKRPRNRTATAHKHLGA